MFKNSYSYCIGFFRCAGLPRLAAEGLLLFCLIKKVTKKSRLGTDVGYNRQSFVSAAQAPDEGSGKMRCLGSGGLKVWG